MIIYLAAPHKNKKKWRLGDISNAAMALPNLIALLLLSGVVFKLAKGQKDAGADHHVDTVEEPVEY